MTRHNLLFVLEWALAGRAVLREECPEDAEFLERLYASSRADEMAQVDWPAELKSSFLRQQHALQRAHYRAHFPEAEYWIITRDELQVGRLYLWPTSAEYRILDLSLLEEARGRGIGGALIGAVQQAARAERCPVTLHVARGNPAIRLYTRLGFARAGENGAYDFMRWSPE